MFFIKYLRTLGFSATNDVFAENAWYFRNALVRANYTNLQFCCKDVFIVRESDITQQFLNYCNQYISDLYTSDLNLDFDQVDVFSMLQQIGFTLYGRDVFSAISLLVDSLVIQTDANSKQVADFALITFVQSLNLTDNQRHELISLLDDKYRVSSIMAIAAGNLSI